MCIRGQKTFAWLLFSTFLFLYSRNDFETGVVNSMHTPLRWSMLETPPLEDSLAAGFTVLPLSLRETEIADRLFFHRYHLQLCSVLQIKTFSDCATNKIDVKNCLLTYNEKISIRYIIMIA